MNWLIRLLLRCKMFWVGRTAWRALVQRAKEPRDAQMELLLSILRRNQGTTFGRERGFEDIDSYASYVEQVAVQDYESLRPYIDKQEREKTPELNSENPRLYAQTSGTTGDPKLVPILEHTVKNYKRSQGLVTYANSVACPGVYDGKVLAITSPHVEGRLETGTAFGSMSGLLSKSMPRLTRKKYVLPGALLDIENYQAKYYLIGAFALADREISFMGTANPSTVLKLAETISAHRAQLISDVRTGNLSNVFDLDAEQFAEVNKSFAASPSRADELEAILNEGEVLNFHALWPDLKTLSVWTGGSVGVLIPEVERLLRGQVRVVELGYLSSEFRGSINVDPVRKLCIPTIHESFFEFVPVDEHGEGEMRFLLVDELEQGQQYYVYITTQEGLYRYFMNDIVEVDGFFHQTPSIQFVQKGKGVVNLTGEKLYEGQVIEAVERLRTAMNLNFDFFILLGDERELQYTLYIDCESASRAEVSAVFEEALRELSVEFDAKRESQRLKETRVSFVSSGTYEAYKEHCIAKGQREGQFKYMVLQYERECDFDFADYGLEATL